MKIAMRAFVWLRGEEGARYVELSAKGFKKFFVEGGL